MRKRIFIYGLFLIASLLGFRTNAETVSQKEALKVAETFFNASYGRVMAKPNLVYNGRRLTTDRLFSPFYVYNHPAGGFVIVSAENKAFPILGYSLKENFDPENLDPGIMALLAEYATDIELIRYDSRPTDEATEAWRDINKFIGDNFKEIYDATDPGLNIEEAKEVITNFETTGRLDELSSDIYYPYQWQEFVDTELSKAGSFPLAIIKGNNLEPVVIHGKKGDYYRIFGGKYNDWLLRLMATENLSYGQIADFGNEFEEIIEEETPFQFYDTFIAETSMNQQKNTISELNEEAIIRGIGGGRYEVILPENAQLMRIYNLSGSVVGMKTYSGSPVVSVSLEGLPYGFYIVHINGESGKSYEYKVSR